MMLLPKAAALTASYLQVAGQNFDQAASAKSRLSCLKATEMLEAAVA